MTRRRRPLGALIVLAAGGALARPLLTPPAGTSPADTATSTAVPRSAGSAAPIGGIAVSGFAFPAPRTGERRDRRNTTRAVRGLLDRAGFPWASPHTFRRTVATLLDAQGVGLATIANVLGHADPSMTARAYLGRKSDTSAVADLL
jgi:integrase